MHEVLEALDHLQADIGILQQKTIISSYGYGCI